MKKLFTLIALLQLIPAAMQAQPADPVSWEFSTDKNDQGQHVLVFEASIDPPWHLYSAHLPEGGPIPTRPHFESMDGFSLSGDIKEVPEPKIKYDEGFKMDVGTLELSARFRQAVSIEPGNTVTIEGYIEYQVCDDATCLPPATEPFSFTLTGGGEAAAGTTTGDQTGTADSEEGSASLKEAVVAMDQDAPAGETGDGEEAAAGTESGERGLTGEAGSEPGASVSGSREVNASGAASATAAEDEKSMWRFFWIAFGAGLLALLTPCVFPMIPMTVSFFMQGSENRARSVFRGSVFGISIIAIYTLLGVIVSLTNLGPDAANALSTHWVPNLIFFILFMIFAFSFFGMFELVLPSKWVNRADSQADKGGIGGAFFMALTTVLVSFSCTGPIVGALLVEAAGGLALKPILGMFGFALAFAIPFTLFAIFPSMLKGLPKSGGWLNTIKVVLGFVVLIFGMKFLMPLDPTGKVLTRELYLAVWMVLFILLGVYFLGKLRFAHDSDIPHVTVPRFFLSIGAFVFAVYLFMGLFGAPMKLVAPLMPAKSAEWIDLTQRQVTPAVAAATGEERSEACTPERHTDLFHMPYGLTAFYTLEEGMECAKETGKPILIDFKGHFCSNCKKMEAAVWSDPSVQRILREEYVIVALYTDDRTKLPEEEWYASEVDGKTKKTIGQQNVDFEIREFGTNTIPLYVKMDAEGNVLGEPRGTDLDVGSYRAWLEAR